MKERIPSIILAVLLAMQAAIALLHVPETPLGGDERYYVAKARYLYEHGRFEKAKPDDLAAEAGAHGNSDWRPQGYPVFVAAVSGGAFDVVPLRRRVALVQVALMLLAVAVAWRLLRPTLPPRRQLAAAAILGIAPWPFGFATQIISDSLNATVAFVALALLVRWTTQARPRTMLLVAGALLSASTLLLRPEMAAVAPVPVAAALLIRHRRNRVPLSHWAGAAAAMLLIVALQFAYRTYFSGRLEPTLFGGLHIYNRGAFAWANSWLGTEHEAYDFVYALGQQRAGKPLPARAFASEEERRTVERLRARVRSEGLTREIDDAFGTLAETRKREDPFGAIVLPRLWHAVHLWVNTETSDQLLLFLSRWPRPPRRALIAGLLLLKAVLLALFVVQVIRRRANAMVAILAAFVVARTLLIGLVLNWMVHRYMLAAWLPLLVVALASDDEPR
jgi:hypothetical protein